MDRGPREPAYGGIQTFCKFSHTRELEGVDVAVVGVPQDQAVTNRPGARFGPRAIREASQMYGSVYDEELGFYDIELGRHLLGGVRIVDYGDVPVQPTLTDFNLDLITEMFSVILQAGVFPLTLGGDHSIAFPVVRAFNGVALDLVHFDTHADFMDDEMGFGLRHTHGNPIKRISELPNINRITQVGMRGLETPGRVHQEAVARGSNIITAGEALENGMDWVVEQVPTAPNIYVTIDIDVLDPSVAPGTGTPEPGGFSYLEMKKILTALPERGNVVGFDIVEVNPLFDCGGITSLVAARLALDFLAAILDGDKH